MDQKTLSIVLATIGALLIIISTSFTMEFMARGLILHKTCSLDDSVCPFIEIPWQGISLISLGAVVMVLAILLYMKPLKTEKESTDIEAARKKLDNLEGDEKDVYSLVVKENGMIFQSKIMDETRFTKVKVSRILDRLEAKKLIERKRRGMTNVVVLK